MASRETANQIEDIYPLSPTQQGMLFHSLESPEATFYFEQFYCSLKGELSVRAFVSAWNAVVQRHSALRAAVFWEGLDHPVQAIMRRVEIPWALDDWRGVSTEEQERRFQTFLAMDRKQGFDLTEAPLMRLRLFHLSPREFRLVWSYLHLLVDGWSTVLVLKEVIHFYQATERGVHAHLPPVRPYRDYVEWLLRQDAAEAESYWRNRLSGLSPVPLTGWRPSKRGHVGDDRAEELLVVDADLAARLRGFARKRKLTLNTCLQGAWAWTLGRSTGAGDVVFGCTTSGRPAGLPGVETIVGLFINTVPVRVKFDVRESVLSCLERLQAEQAEASRYEHAPLMEIRRWSGLSADHPLFETLFVFENYATEAFESNYGTSSADTREGSGVDLKQATAIEKVHYPLMLTASNHRELKIKISYDAEWFSSEFVRRLLRLLRSCLAGLVDDPETLIGHLSLASSEDDRLLDSWNDTAHCYGPVRCAHELVEDKTQQTPDAIAVIFEETRLTYSELSARSNQLARYLRALGVQEEERVAVCLERSQEMVIALLGVLKAGGAYVPLDPSYPTERLWHMLSDAAARALITNREQEFPSANERHIIRIDSDSQIWTQSRESLALATDPDCLAYVIYTSGSTGTPKGAMNTHAAVSNRLLWMQQEYGFDDSDRVLQKTPFSFDVSVWEFFLPLISGASIVMALPDGHRDPSYLARTILAEGVTAIHFVPSMLAAFAQEVPSESIRSLRVIFCSGEELPATLARRTLEWFGGELHNLYGPTEAAVDVSFYRCRRERVPDRVPIGVPIANTQLYIVDQDRQIAPIGCSGELSIGGVGVGRGYLSRPDLTAERFVPLASTSQPGARFYRTGDLARWTDCGQLEFLGRIDYQVKIRGFRIELGEIEAVLSGHPSVKQCAVTLRKSGDAPALAAYVVLRNGAAASDAELRQVLRNRLPEYMVPSVFVELQRLPLTPNGKVDRRSLPASDHVATRSNRRGPRDSIETALKQLWEEALKIEHVGIDDNFFDHGGHSLSALSLATSISRMTGSDVAVHTIFERPTVSLMAEFLRQGVSTWFPLLVPLQRRGSRPPLYCVHPGGGLVNSFVELARHLGPDQPVFAFQSRGFQEGETPFASISEMAKAYIDAMSVNQPEGPYNIAGLSMGAAVAYEMARQLSQAGRAVSLLALLDGACAPEPVQSEYPSEQEILDWEAWYVKKTTTEDLKVAPEEIEGLDHDAKILKYLESAKAADVIPRDVTFAQIRRFLRVFAFNDSALASYRPKTYRGKAWLIRSDKPEALDDSFGWRALALGGVSVYEIPGRHGHFVREPGVRKLASLLRSLIDECQSEAPRLEATGVGNPVFASANG